MKAPSWQIICSINTDIAIIKMFAIDTLVKQDAMVISPEPWGDR